MRIREEIWIALSKYPWGSHKKRKKAYQIALELAGLGKAQDVSGIDRIKLEAQVIDILERAGILQLTQDGPRVTLLTY